MPTLNAGQSKTLIMAPGWVVNVSAPANAIASVVDTPYEVGQTIDTQSNQARQSPVGPVSFNKTFGPYDAGATVVIANAATSGATVTYTLQAVAKGPMQLTWAERPDPVLNAGAIIEFTDVGGGVEFQGYGAPRNRWKINNNDALLDNIDTQNNGVTGVTPQQLNPNHILIPGGVIGATGDRLFSRIWFVKSGGTDTCSLAIKIGSTGTNSDTTIATVPIQATSRKAEIELWWKRVSATQLQLVCLDGQVSAINGEAITAAAAAVTVQNLDTVDQYFSIIATMGGTTDTPSISDYTLRLSHTDAN